MILLRSIWRKIKWFSLEICNRIGGVDPNQFNKLAVHPLQAWEWEKFREAWGNEAVRLKNCLVIFSKIPYLNLKIGTVIRGPKPDRKQIEELKKLGTKENAIFIKLEPNVLFDQKLALQLKTWGLIPGRRLFTPTSFRIDLTLSEEDLMKSFSSKTRYNIRLAQRHGVTIKEDTSEKAFEKYIQLTRETVERQGFYAHTEKYHRLMWQFLKPAGIAHLLTAKYKNQIITTWIVFVWKDFLYYPYGASSDKFKNVMASNLMMWEAILFGKKLGLKTFDLWGREEGKGFTRFKEGYNPKVVEFIGTWDLVINKPFYWLYRLAETLRWPILRLKSKIVKPRF